MVRLDILVQVAIKLVSIMVIAYQGNFYYTDSYRPNMQKGFAHLLVLFLLLLGGLALGLYLVQKPQPLNPQAAETAATEVSVLRIYNPTWNFWTWTGNTDEINKYLSSQFYQNGGALFNAYSAENHPAGTVPLYFLTSYSDPQQTFMTTNEAEV